jgi:hypothetical protein
MRNMWKAMAAACVVATSSLGVIAPAAAHADGGDALIAGILGLGVGAAIASDHPHYHRHYYHRYYDDGYYAPPPAVYYAPPAYEYYAPPRRYYYRDDDDD